MMTPHQKRVVEEKDELDKKIAKLKAFFSTDVYTSLDEAEKDRLTRQSKVMITYSKILTERISVF